MIPKTFDTHQGLALHKHIPLESMKHISIGQVVNAWLETHSTIPLNSLTPRSIAQGRPRGRRLRLRSSRTTSPLSCVLSKDTQKVKDGHVPNAPRGTCARSLTDGQAPTALVHMVKYQIFISQTCTIINEYTLAYYRRSSACRTRWTKETLACR